MELRHLRYFIAVAEEENISRAALQLHVSQPGVSRQIHDLEDELGFLLLERTAQSVRLTDAGKIFLDEARAVMARAQEAVGKARAAAAGAHGEIHVGYAPSLTVQILPQTLRAFQREFSKVRVVLHDLSTEEMLAQLSAGKLPVALLVRPCRSMLRGLKFEALASYPKCVAVRPDHPLAKLRSVTIAQIVREPLIGYSRKDYPEYHEELAATFAVAKAKPRVAEEHEGVNELIAAVESGRGLALVPGCLACMTGTRLKLIPLKPAEVTVVGAAWKAAALSLLAEKFIAAARSCRTL